MINHILLFCCILCISVVYAQECCQQNQNVLSVQGQGAVKVVANIAEINLGIESIDTSVIKVQRNITQISNRVMDMLEMLGASKITSQSLSIHPQYNYKEENTRISGYRGMIRVSFESDVKDAGRYIAAAFNEGVNRIHSYTMKPDDKTLERTKHLAIRKAAMDAMEKGDTVLSTLSLKRKGFKSVNINTNNYIPRRHTRSLARAGMQMMDASEAIAPKITATEQEISATIHVTMFYE